MKGKRELDAKQQDGKKRRAAAADSASESENASMDDDGNAVDKIEYNMPKPGPHAKVNPF